MTIQEASKRANLKPFYIHALIRNKIIGIRAINKEIHVSYKELQAFMDENSDAVNAFRHKNSTDEHCPMYEFLQKRKQLSE